LLSSISMLQATAAVTPVCAFAIRAVRVGLPAIGLIPLLVRSMAPLNSHEPPTVGVIEGMVCAVTPAPVSVP
jgi:hypothetical protein